MENISYSELAKRVGDCVMNNEIQSHHEFELFNGDDQPCQIHETTEECVKDNDKCEFESVDVYQTYIISQDGAEYLKRVSSEIVYYSDELNMYLWGITHFGTSWTHVFTNIKSN